MKGMSFGQGTGYQSPQLMKKEAAMKMKKEAAMKLKKDSAMDMKKGSAMDMKKGPMTMKKGSAMDMKKGSAMDMKKSPMNLSEWEKALKRDPNLNNLVAARNKAKKEHGKNSKEYATAQNRVNVAYENAKRHGQTTTSESKTNKVTGRTKTTTTVNTPGVGSETTTRVTGRSGGDIKSKKVTEKDSYYVPVGERGKTTEVTKAGKDSKLGTGDDKKKTRTKKRFRDTKLGRTKVGQKFVKKENRVKK